MKVRISISKATVKELVEKLHQAYRAGDVRLVRRVSALLALARCDSVASIGETLGVSPASVYDWLKKLMLEGVAGLAVQWKARLADDGRATAMAAFPAWSKGGS